jgi:ADP-heptose:LPS heptosyltransferase
MNIKTNLKAFFLKAITKKKHVSFDIKNSSKVLMMRYDRIGDMIITTPVFRELKKSYPHIEINVLASKTNSIVIKNNPYVDNVFISKQNNFLFDLIILYRLRKKQIDVCFEFDHSVIRHAIFRLKIINPKKVISVNKDGRYGVSGNDLKLYDIYTKKQKNAHFRDIWMATLEPFNIKNVSSQYDIFIDQSVEAIALEFLNNYKNKFLVGINLEGAVKGKKISFEELEKICHGIFDINNNLQIFIITLPNKMDEVQSEVEMMGLDYVTTSFLTSNILMAAALIKNLDLIITPDTSIVHVASTFNKPVISIHEDNKESYKLFAPTSDLSRTIFSKKNNSIKGFSTNSVIEAYSELFHLLKFD